MKVDLANLELVTIEGELALVVRIGRSASDPLPQLQLSRRVYSVKMPPDDPLRSFVPAATVVRIGARCKARRLFEAYELWCKRTGAEPVNRRVFRCAMIARGFRQKHSNGAWWLDIALIEDEPQSGRLL